MMKKVADVDDYIKTYPKDVQVRLKKIRQTIRKTAPKSVESISYGMAGYKLNGWPLVYFAGCKNHIGFYALPKATKAFAKELSKFKTSKGTIRFPNNEEIPYDLVSKIVFFRVKEVLAKKPK